MAPSIYALSLLVSFFSTIEASLSVSNCEGCQAYACLEEKEHCGTSGYLIAYGKKYCDRFNSTDTLYRFSEVGKKFLACTTKCLVKFLYNYVKEKPSASCSTIETAAFDSHVNCYLGCDFCEVCKTEKMALLRSYDLWDFAKLNALRQVFQTLRQCGSPLNCLW